MRPHSVHSLSGQKPPGARFALHPADDLALVARHYIHQQKVDDFVGYRKGLSHKDLFTIYEFDMPASDNQIIGFNSTIEADGWYVLIKPFYQGGDRSLLVFDTAAKTTKLIDTGFVVVDAQLLYIKR